jgi:hypothetical protein
MNMFYDPSKERIRIAMAGCMALHELDDLTRPVDSEILIHSEQDGPENVLWGEFQIGISFIDLAFDAKMVRELTEDEMLEYLLRPRNALMSLMEKYPETAILLAVNDF